MGWVKHSEADKASQLLMRRYAKLPVSRVERRAASARTLRCLARLNRIAQPEKRVKLS